MVPSGCWDFIVKVPAPMGHAGELAKVPAAVFMPVSEFEPEVTVKLLPVQLVVTETANVRPMHVPVAVIFSLMHLHCESVLPVAQTTL